MNTFKLDRAVFVSGLHWQILTGKPSAFKSEIKDLAKQLSFDLAVVRKTGVPQVGLGALNEGGGVGMFSAAAIISKTVEVESNQRDFICATKVPDGRFLYVCQSEGVILADGDFIGTAEDVRSRMLEDLSVGKAWEAVFAPIEWGLSGSSERDFVDFLPQKKGKVDLNHSWWALRRVEMSVFAPLKKMLFPLLGVAVLGAGAYGYKAWQAEQAEAARLAAAASGDAAAPPPPPPWTTKPRATAAIGACLEAINKVNTFWPGNWSPVSASCNVASGSMTVSWKRGEYGWAKHLLEIEPRATITPDGAMASLVIPVQVTVEGANEDLVAEHIRSAQMNNAAQELRVQFSMAPPAAPAVLPGAAAQQAAPVQSWHDLAWLLKANGLSPDSLIPAFDGPGFRVGSVTALFDSGKISWEIEGVQYVQ